MIVPAEPDFSISVRFENSAAALVAVTGELDLSTAPKLARALEDLPSEATDIRVSLRDVWFADVDALSRLARTRHRLRLQGRRMVVTDAGDTVRGLMRAAGVLEELTGT